MAGADVLWVVLLALVPALAPTLWLRLALGRLPPRSPPPGSRSTRPSTGRRRGFFEPVSLTASTTASSSTTTSSVPFNRVEQPQMHGVARARDLRLLPRARALALAARRPLPAVLAVLAGAGVAGDALPGGERRARRVHPRRRALGPRRVRRAPPVAARWSRAPCSSLAAAGASTSAAVAKDGVLAWERWDPNGTARRGVASATSGTRTTAGSSSRRRRRPSCASAARSAALYWRATTLDQFDRRPLDRGPDAALDRPGARDGCRTTRCCPRAR